MCNYKEKWLSLMLKTKKLTWKYAYQRLNFSAKTAIPLYVLIETLESKF